jgi:oligopeptide/dipeptide ABC transporter ATP-binding protein
VIEITTLLEVRSLRTYLTTYWGLVKAVDGTDFRLEAGDILGLVGETGCGKTMTGMSILRLLPPSGRIVGGEIIFEGENLLEKSEAEMRTIRGAEISMIFQEPLSSLNPVLAIGSQMKDVIMQHQQKSRKEARESALQLLRRVGLPDPEAILKRFPHELSGGMRQRAMIAMALSCKPKLLIADEPTTALDVTIQAQILELIRSLKQEFEMAVVFITHDLGVVAKVCNKVAVMYAGKVVEFSLIQEFFKDPRHPYTQALLAALPNIRARGRKLPVIEGTVPSGINLPRGCRFHPRCPYTMPKCREVEPPLFGVTENHQVMCFPSE